MVQTSAGLPSGGLTSYYAITYESSLPAALGVDLAQGLMDVCDQDFVLMSDWFAGTDFKFAVPTHIALNNASGGASWSAPAYPPPDGHHVTVQMNSVPNPADNNPPDPADTVNFVRFQVVAEVTEMFMYSKQNGWTGAGGDEGSKGEGLSRFLSCQLLTDRGLTDYFPAYDLVRDWLNTVPRPNFVDNAPDDNGADVVNGCTSAFIYYLHYQLGFDITAIINAGSDTLAGVYQKLTGRTDGWDSFNALVDLHYPPGNTYTAAGNGIFPVPILQSVPPASVVAGSTGELTVQVSPINRVDVYVSLVCDSPRLLTVPSKVLIPAGTGTVFVPIIADAFVGAPTQSVAVHATYAGTTMTADVEIHPRPSILSGTVRDAATGQPISGAVVIIDDGVMKGGVHYQLLTSAVGAFATDTIPPHTYTIATSASGYVPQIQQAIVGEGDPDTDVTISLVQILPYVVHGTVADTRGAGIAGAAVVLAWVDSPDQRFTTVTDQHGAYVFAENPGQYIDDYLLTVTQPGYVDGTATFGIPNGANLQKDFTLVRTGTLIGFITDSAAPGTPVANASVQAGTATATSDAAGRYQVELPPGPVSVTVQAFQFELSTAEATVVSGVVTTTDFALVEASSTLQGLLLDAVSTLPIRGAHIAIEGSASVTTDPDGAFTVTRIPAGHRQITEHAQGYPVGHDYVDFVAHQTETVTFYLAAGPNPHPP